MNSTLNNLLNTSFYGLSGVCRAPDDGAGAGSGESAPAATPAPAAADSGAPKAGDPAKAIEATPEPDDNGSMFAMPSDDALFSLEEESEAVPVKEPAAAPTATPTTPPAAEVTPQATSPAAAPGTAAAPAAAPAPAATPPATPQAAPEATPPEQQLEPHQAFLQLLDSQRPALAAELAKTYAISDADAEAIGIVDKAPLERLAANLHLNVMRAMTAMTLQTLPGAIDRIITQRSRVEELTNAFYEANKELDRKTDHPIVLQYANMFWQTNPKGTLEQFNKQVGTMAKAHLNKLTPTVVPPPAPGVTPKKVAPKQTPTFVPATPGGAAPANAKGAPQGGDLWGALAERMMNPDDD